MTVGQLRSVIRGLPDEAKVMSLVASAPFDDEAVELIDARAADGQVLISVAVVDNVTRELRAQEESLRF